MSDIINMQAFQCKKITQEIVDSMRDAAIAATEAEFCIKKLSLLLSEDEFNEQCKTRGISPKKQAASAKQRRAEYFNVRLNFKEFI